jgi:DNA-binding NarL/FixJ family response regulator
MRRGEAGAQELLEEALKMALPTGELQRIGRVYAARGELAWHRRDLDGVLRETELGLEHTVGHQEAWIKGELAWLRSRATAVEASMDLAEAYRHAVLKDWNAAAAAFERHAMPFEHATMLLQAGGTGIAAAAQIVERIGAAVLRSELAQAEQSSSARGGARNENAHGLTKRELEVLRLLGSGYTNAELAEKLCLSAKTIDHHVSAILGKLQVRSRAHAVTAGYELGLIGRK